MISKEDEDVRVAGALQHGAGGRGVAFQHLEEVFRRDIGALVVNVAGARVDVGAVWLVDDDARCGVFGLKKRE